MRDRRQHSPGRENKRPTPLRNRRVPMSITLIARSLRAAAPFGQKAGVVARLLGWIRQSRDANCVAALDPQLAADAGLSARPAWHRRGYGSAGSRGGRFEMTQREPV